MAASHRIKVLRSVRRAQANAVLECVAALIGVCDALRVAQAATSDFFDLVAGERRGAADNLFAAGQDAAEQTWARRSHGVSLHIICNRRMRCDGYVSPKASRGQKWVQRWTFPAAIRRRLSAPSLIC